MYSVNNITRITARVCEDSWIIHLQFHLMSLFSLQNPKKLRICAHLHTQRLQVMVQWGLDARALPDIFFPPQSLTALTLSLLVSYLLPPESQRLQWHGNGSHSSYIGGKVICSRILLTRTLHYHLTVFTNLYVHIVLNLLDHHPMKDLSHSCTKLAVLVITKITFCWG